MAAREIAALLRDKSYEDRAADVGARVRTETGLAKACDLREGLLEKSYLQPRAFQLAEGMS